MSTDSNCSNDSAKRSSQFDDEELSFSPGGDGAYDSDGGSLDLSEERNLYGDDGIVQSYEDKRERAIERKRSGTHWEDVEDFEDPEDDHTESEEDEDQDEEPEESESDNRQQRQQLERDRQLLKSSHTKIGRGNDSVFLPPHQDHHLGSVKEVAHQANHATLATPSEKRKSESSIGGGSIKVMKVNTLASIASSSDTQQEREQAKILGKVSATP